MLLSLKEYHRPTTLEEAVHLLHRPDRRTALLAGGTELVGRDDDQTEAVIDLRHLGLTRVEREGNRLILGAMLTLKALEKEPALQELADGLLPRASKLSAPATIRAAATLGGTLAGTKGGEELPTALLALGARVRLAGAEPAEIAMAQFLEQREELLTGAIITHLVIPATPDATSGLARVSRSPADRSIILAVAVVADGSPTVALGGLTAYPRLLPQGSDSDQVAALTEGWEAIADFRASGEYRRWVAPILVRRALDEAGGVRS